MALSKNQRDLLGEVGTVLRGGLKKIGDTTAKNRTTFNPTGKVTALSLLADIVSGKALVSEFGKDERKTILGLDIDKLRYNKGDGLAQLGLTKKDIGLKDFKSLKSDLRGFLDDGQITNQELRSFRGTARDVLESTEKKRLRDKAKLKASLTDPNRQIHIAGTGKSTLGFLDVLAGSFASRRTVASGVGTTLGREGRYGGTKLFGQRIAGIQVGT